MTIQYINTGSSPNAGNGDNLRTAFTKVNNNFNYLLSNLSTTTNTSTILTTASDITIRSLELLAGLAVKKSLAIGEYQLSPDGNAYLRNGGTQSSLLVLSNDISGPAELPVDTSSNPEIVIRGYGKTSNIILESGRGTYINSSATLKFDTLGAIYIGGYNGTGWHKSDTDISAGSLVFWANEDFNSNSIYTINAGTNFTLSTQPSSIKLTSISKMRWLSQYWSTITNTNLSLNNITIGATASPILELYDSSTFYQGFGKTNVNFNNAPVTINGVTDRDFASFSGSINGVILSVNTVTSGVISLGQQIYGNNVTTGTYILTEGLFTGTYFLNVGSVAENINMTAGPDNNTLLDTNKLIIQGSRRSGVDNRQNALHNGDSIGKIEFNGQSNNNSISSSATTVGNLAFQTLEHYTTSAAGSRFYLSTINSGTTVLSEKLSIDDKNAILTSDAITFKNISGTTLLSVSSSTTMVNNLTFPNGTVQTTGYNFVTGIPSSSTSTGIKGQIAITGTNMYLCIGTNSWLRFAGSTFESVQSFTVGNKYNMKEIDILKKFNLVGQGE